MAQALKRTHAKVVDRPLTEEELRKIDEMEGYRPQHREVVEKFTKNGNRPLTRKDFTSFTHIEEVNGILRRAGLPFGVYPVKWSNGGGEYYKQEICFREVYW